VTTESVEVGAAVSSWWSHCETTVAEEDFSADPSFRFTFGAKGLTQWDKRGTLAAGDTPDRYSSGVESFSPASRDLWVRGLGFVSSRRRRCETRPWRTSIVDLTHSRDFTGVVSRTGEVRVYIELLAPWMPCRSGDDCWIHVDHVVFTSR